LKASKKPWVCLEQDCFKCFGTTELPEDCPYAILHALDLLEVGITEKPRRSGKTTVVCSLANRIRDAGYTVLILTPKEEIRTYVERVCGFPKKKLLNVFTIHDIQWGLRGMVGTGRVFVFTDEVTPDEWQKVLAENPNLKNYQFVLGYYTEPPPPEPKDRNVFGF
jgi:hypothetical protein